MVKNHVQIIFVVGVILVFKQSTRKEKINDRLAEIFAKIGSKENTREVSSARFSKKCKL